MGVPWPEASDTVATHALNPVAEARQKHWAFRPVEKPAVPRVSGPVSPQTAVDCFILAKLADKGMLPAELADRQTLIRRATFDLTGLPPTPEEVAAFEADASPDAFTQVVDRLLASPGYGERWGRHWLDVARYADSKGYVLTQERRFPYSFTYRDYVIRAFNEDLPYNRFIVEQLAADRLPLGDDKRPLAAMGYLTLGRRFLNNTHDIIDDRIDVVTRGLLGLTVTCARCHDHKFDPIPTKDYYSLYGVFASSIEPKEQPLLEAPKQTELYLSFEKELQARKQKVADFRANKQGGLNTADRNELTKLQNTVAQWETSGPGAPPRGMVLNDAPSAVQPHVFLRGNPGNRGPEVPRQFLEVLAGEKRQPFHQGSGRLELAEAIASRDNPLTARVMVNRIWLHHFGAGLVRTPSDFGLRGDPPTHRELLDYLTSTFMENGWSIKSIQRLIMLSRVYQQSSQGDPRYQVMDPDNQLLWKMNRQRLEFEALRDSLLAVAGRLDRTAGGRPVELTKPPFQPRRSVYGFIDRQNLPGLFRTFDFANPDATSPQRHVTTVPKQALFLMNSPFVVEQAQHLVQRPDIATLAKPEQRIDRLYRVVYGRAPSTEEISLGVRFVETESEGTWGANATPLAPWQKYAQVLLLANEFVFVD
jgi:hypothetical protein